MYMAWGTMCTILCILHKLLVFIYQMPGPALCQDIAAWLLVLPSGMASWCRPTLSPPIHLARPCPLKVDAMVYGYLSTTHTIAI